MTISSETNRISYAGSGTTGPFTLPAALTGTNETYVKATKVVDATGVETLLTLTTDYTIDAGVTELTTVANVASGETLVITIGITKTQGTDYIANDPFAAETHEDALDKLTLITQELGEADNRAISLTITSSLSDITIPDPGADKYVKWNSAGTALELSTLSATAGLGNITEDTSPQLGGDLDCNSYDIQFDDSTGIRDDSDNEVLLFEKSASAVNYIVVRNSITGAAPRIDSQGDDTNIDMSLRAKGTGAIVLEGNAAGSAELRIAEDTDNGSNYIGIKSPAAVTTSTTFTLPDGDGSANTMLLTNASGTLSWSTLTGVAATQAEQETGTSTTAVVTPGRQQYHPSAAKGWVSFNGTGTPAISSSYNVASITDNGTGDYDVVWSTDFSSASYAVTGSAGVNGGQGGTGTNMIANLTTDSNIKTLDNGNNLYDPSYVSLVAYGDQ